MAMAVLEMAKLAASSPIAWDGLIIVVVVILATLTYNALWHPISDIPGPLVARISPLWIVWSLCKRNVNEDLRNAHAKYGPILRTGPNEVSFATVDSLETIYHGHNPRTGHFLKAHQEPFHVVLPGPSIFTAHEVADHRKMRKKIEPIFSARALGKQEYLYRQHIDALCQQVSAKLHSHNNVVNLSNLISSEMFEMISDLAFGESLEKGRKPFENLLENVGYMLAAYEIFGFLLLWIGSLVRYTLRLLPGSLVAMDFVGAKFLRTKMIKSEDRGDFLAAIMEDQKSTGTVLKDPELQGNAIFLFAAGYMTSSISLSATLYHVLREPQHLHRLQKELRTTFSRVEDMNLAVLQHLPYLNACINESIRLIPPFHLRFASRTSPGAEISGVYVPKGVIVFSDIYTMQRSASYWAHPDEFRPERWLDSGPGTLYVNDNKATFRPFLLGERLCMGRRMFYHVAYLLLAQLLLEFDLEMVDRNGFVWERDVATTALWLDYHRLQVRVSRSGTAGAE